MGEHEIVIVWFDRDLRVADHLALTRACGVADVVVPLFVDDEPQDGWPRSKRQSIWLRRSLEALGEALRERGSSLIFRRGSSAEVVPQVAKEVGAQLVIWNRRYRPGLRRRDKHVSRALREIGIEVETTSGRLLHEPEEIRTTTGGPYHVFTPFWRKFQKVVDVFEPLDEPELGPEKAPSTWPKSDGLDAISKAGEASWLEYWQPGEEGARKTLERFVESGLADYVECRDRPDRTGTSRLSPHLRFGEVSPRQVWQAVGGAEEFRRQLVWREFSYHLLHHYPHTAEEPLREKFKDFAWRDDEEGFERWKNGETGYPIVDAGMRQLRETGWMHNRVRMIVASFLTKDLLIPWQKGARWFWENLVDADLANNTMGWQWSAGCGADAQPFFRVFNPVKQGKRYDPDGEYVRRFVPELEGLSGSSIHAPWEASTQELAGTNYPEPIVDHGEAREIALNLYNEIK